MDNLLCDESWLLSSPLTPEPLPSNYFSLDDDVAMFPAATVEETFSMDLEKESSFSNYGDKYIDFLVSKKLIYPRFQAVQWLIQTRNRLNLSYETLFSAANCFDRFVYLTSCYEWTSWMVELVVVTSLSIASKFNEAMSFPSLEELEMETGLNHIFHHKTVLQMELIMLKALEWRVHSVTSYSFSQIIVSKIGFLRESTMMMDRITNHLLDDLCDLNMVEYPPSVVAVSAIWNVVEEKMDGDENIGGRIMNLFGQEHNKEKIVKCIDKMKSRNMDQHWLSRAREGCEVKSLLSLLLRGDIMNITGDYGIEDLSAMFQMKRSDKKRDQEHYEVNIRPAKRMTIVMSN